MRSFFKGDEFVSIVERIFQLHGFETENLSQVGQHSYDLSATRASDPLQLAIEVKLLLNLSAPVNRFLPSINRLDKIAKIEKKQAVLVIGGKFSYSEELQKNSDVIIYDIQNLLYLVQDEESLRNDLIGLLDFSVESVKTVKPDLISPVVTEENDQKLVQELILKIDTWNKTGREGAQGYEELCIEALRALFIDDLSLWEKQKSSNDILFRFDLICKIKNGVDKDFWNIAQKHFNTKYIIFEFKNYSKKITQKEIYTTERYLYAKALRNIAIIISPYEPQKNAIAAIHGSLRENGKLILYITKADILEMLNAKLDNNDPADFLSDKLDDMLVKLGK